jgi:hypothetical protein
MRTATLALTLVAVCAASSAIGQARVLSTPDQAQDQAPAAKAPAPRDAAPSGEAPPDQARTPAPAQKQEPGPRRAQDEGHGPPADQERFSFTHVTGGLLRLDRKSSAVAFCRAISGGWVCDAVPEERVALEKEIDQLRDEVAALKKEITALRAPSPPPVPPQTVPPSPQTGEGPIKLPTAEDIARARAFVVETWHRLVEMIESWQKDLLRKS